LNPIAQQTEAQARRSAAAQSRRSAAEIERLSQVGEELRRSRRHARGRQAARRAQDRVRAPVQHVPGLREAPNEAQVQAQLERRQLGEQFRVLEAAFKAPEPSAPNRV
jgi:hypothetical protein